MKSLKEKWLSMVQSAAEKGEKGIGGSSIVTIYPWSLGFLKREDASTSPSLTLDRVLVATNNRSMTFPITLQGKNKTIDTSVLIDSGATGNFMDLRLLSRDNFVLIQLPTPILAYNVDGTTNQKGTIRWKVRTTITLGNHSHPIELMILRLNIP